MVVVVVVMFLPQVYSILIISEALFITAESITHLIPLQIYEVGTIIIFLFLDEDTKVES